MSKKSFLGLTVVIVLLVPSLARMETPGFSVVGKIIFKNKGDLYIKVVNETEFNEGKDSIYRDIIKIGEEEIKKKEVGFRFNSIPQGTYGILCFQDANRNGTLDTNVIGLPTEPWGVSRNVRPFLRKPKFEEIAFELNKDITDIRLKIK